MARKFAGLARRATVVAGSLFSGVVLILALLGWRLAQGPMSLEIARPWIERWAEAAAPGVLESYGQVRARWDRERGALEIEAIGVLLDPAALGAGERLGPDDVLHVPRAAIGVDFDRLAHRGEFGAAYLAISGPQIQLTRTGAGELDLEVAGGAGEIDLDRFARWAPRRIEVRDAGVTLADEGSGFELAADDADLIVDLAALREGRARASLGFALDQRASAEAPPARIEADLALEDDRSMAIALGFSDLAPATALEALDLDRVLVPEILLDGAARFVLDADGRFEPIAFRASGADGRLAPSDQLEAETAIEAIELDGLADLDRGVLRLTRAIARLDGAHLELSGRFATVDGGIEASGEARIDRIEAPDLARLWPLALAPKARAWVTRRLEGGAASEVELAFSFTPAMLDADPLPAGLVRGGFRFEDVELVAYDPVPPLRGASGRASFDANTLLFEVERGRMGGVETAGARIEISGLGARGPRERLGILAPVAGDLDDAIAIAGGLPIGRALREEPAFSNLSGAVVGELSIELPLLDGAPIERVDYRFDAQLEGVRIRGAREGIDLEAERLSLEVDRAGARIEGPARVNGVPAALRVERAGERIGYRIEGRFPAEAIAPVLGRAPVEIDGALGLVLDVEETPDGARSLEIETDWSEASLAVPAIAWSKPISHGGSARARLRLPPDGAASIERFEAETADLRIAGSLELDLSGALRRLELARFKWGDTVVAIDASRDANGAIRAAIRGPSLDLEPVWRRRGLGGEGGEGPDLALSIEVDRLLLGRGAASSARLEVDRRDGVMRSLDFEALAGPERARIAGGLRADVSGVGGGWVEAADLGALANLLGSRSITGGRAQGRFEVLAQRPGLRLRGALDAREFMVEGAPLLARVLTIASLDGLGNLLAGQGLGFDRLNAPFDYRDGVARISGARLTGSQLGLVAEGAIDLNADVLDLDGSLAPAYSLNYALGQIPILGRLMRGQDADGALAVTFAVRGPLANPSVTANPLSVVVPGALRDLFDVDP